MRHWKDIHNDIKNQGRKVQYMQATYEELETDVKKQLSHAQTWEGQTIGKKRDRVEEVDGDGAPAAKRGPLREPNVAIVDDSLHSGGIDPSLILF